MLQRHTEPERFHCVQVAHLGLHRTQHVRRSLGIRRQQLTELRAVVGAPRTEPLHRRQIHRVAHDEVVERREEILLERIPQPQFRRRVPIEEHLAHVLPVGSLWRRGESEQLSRLEVVEDASVRRRRRVVELVDDDDVVRRRVDGRQICRGERLHTREHVRVVHGTMPVDEQLAEVRVTQHLRVRAPRLLEDLSAMRDEQQPRAVRAGTHSLVIERRHHRLAGTRRRDDEVAVAAVNRAVRLELLQHARLVRPRCHLKTREADALALLPAGRREQGTIEPFAIATGVVRLESGVRPIAVERCLELAHERRRRDVADAHVPLDAVEQRRRRQVRRAHEPRAVPAVAVKDPGLRVQARTARLVVHLHLGAVLRDQPIERPSIRAPRVRARDDADRHPVVLQPPQLILDDADARPHDEGTQQVDAIGRCELVAQLAADTRLALCVRQQRRLRQAGTRATRVLTPGAESGGGGEREELGEFILGKKLVVLVLERSQDLVDAARALVAV